MLGKRFEHGPLRELGARLLAAYQSERATRMDLRSVRGLEVPELLVHLHRWEQTS